MSFKRLIGIRQYKKAVTFDGANDDMKRGADLTGNANGKTGIISMFFRLAGGDGTIMTLYDSGAGVNYVRRTAANKIAIAFKDAGSNNDLVLQSSSNYTAGAAWHHLLASWDVASALSHLYIDDTDDEDVGGTTKVNDTLVYTGSNHAIGGETDGTDRFNGDLAVVHIDYAAYLDITVAANRRNFIDAAGRPAVAMYGSPIVHQSVRRGDAATVFATNKGSGGNFTITGALAIAATLPDV